MVSQQLIYVIYVSRVYLAVSGEEFPDGTAVAPLLSQKTIETSLLYVVSAL